MSEPPCSSRSRHPLLTQRPLRLAGRRICRRPPLRFRFAGLEVSSLQIRRRSLSCRYSSRSLARHRRGRAAFKPWARRSLSALREDAVCYTDLMFSISRKLVRSHGPRVPSRSLSRACIAKGAMSKESDKPGAKLARASVRAFKYAMEIADTACAPCPLPDCKPMSATVFRLVHSPTIAKDFLPVRKLTPNRRFFDNSGRCSGWALSLWKSEQLLRKKLGVLFASRPARRKLGDHVATVEIAESDGVCTVPDDWSHFGLFEYAGADISYSCKIVGPMP